MILQQTKVYVPTNSEFKNGTVGLEFTEKQGYFLNKEELERVIGNAFDAGMKRHQNTPMYVSGSVDIEFEKHPSKQDYINSILK
jgi:hypothetical protein